MPENAAESHPSSARFVRQHLLDGIVFFIYQQYNEKRDTQYCFNNHRWQHSRIDGFPQ
jgi:hypothetical protein